MKNWQPFVCRPSELRSLRYLSTYVRSAVGHRQQPGLVMCQGEVLISELLSAVDCPRSSAIAIDEVASLDHEVLDLCKCQYGLSR